MLGILDFIQQVLSTPAIFVGLIALLGLLLQKKDAQTCIKGTIKTILGFIVLNAGSEVVQDAIIPFGELFQGAFGVEGVVPNNEAITSLGLNEFAVQTASIFALGMCANIVLARFSKLKYIFLTGHHALYMACLIAIIMSISGLTGAKLIIAGALLLGLPSLDATHDTEGHRGRLPCIGAFRQRLLLAERANWQAVWTGRENHNHRGYQIPADAVFPA